MTYSSNVTGVKTVDSLLDGVSKVCTGHPTGHISAFAHVHSADLGEYHLLS